MADELEADQPVDADVDDWEDHVAFLRETFINDLVRRGFRLTSDKSEGARSDAVLTDSRVTVLVEDGFPYTPPRVRTEVPGPMSWHRDSLGHMCLYTARDHDGQPWLDADVFLARIEEWFAKNDAGWPDDPPALDMEAYLNLPVDSRFILYSDLDTYTDDYVKLRGDQGQVRLEGAGKVPKRSTKGYLSGYVTDIGEVATPPIDWEALIESVPEPDKIRGAIERARVDVLLVQYRRGDQRGALAVTFPADDHAQPSRRGNGQGGRRTRSGNGSRGGSASQRHPHLAFSGSADAAAMRLRSGSAAAALKDKHVYVVGAGALGSHICDGLVRAGLGHLTVRDFQTLTPGNMTRHLVANLLYVGHNKARVVEAVLKNRPYSRTKIESVPDALTSPAEAAELLRGYDLVVDATADGSVTCMVEAAAGFTGIRFVTTCLQNEGRSMRVDVVPPLDGATPLAPTVIRPSSTSEVFEAGCGLPVSPTPPYAVAEAAAIAVRHSVGLLAGTPESPAGEHRDLD